MSRRRTIPPDSEGGLRLAFVRPGGAPETLTAAAQRGRGAAPVIRHGVAARSRRRVVR
ncbi:hypothetical protein ACWGCW_03535 [Streptomyces sp. NPDC054933]